MSSPWSRRPAPVRTRPGVSAHPQPTQPGQPGQWGALPYARTPRSAAEATVPAGIRPQCAQEVDVAEVRPVRLAEVELGRRALPEQEAAEPLLARRADHEVGVRLALRVEVLRDVVGRQRLRD